MSHISQNLAGHTRFKIEVENIHMAFPLDSDQVGAKVLSDVSFGIQNASFVSILGPSGCGKTTLVKIIAGLVSPTHGVVKVDGHSIYGPSPDRTVIFQEYGLFEWKTVFGNIEFGLKAKGMSKQRRRENAQRFIDLVHLRGSEYKYPNELFATTSRGTPSDIKRSIVLPPSSND